MIAAILAIHILACLFLVFVVLLQTGKGADIGAVFGGSSQTIFGSSGAGNLLTKLTTGTAVVFMLTSLTLAYNSTARRQRALVDTLPLAETPATAPVEAPEGSAAPASETTTEAVTIPVEAVATTAEAPPPGDSEAPAAESESP